MSRLHAAAVDVRTAATPAGPQPNQFLWQGRLYLVREVLDRWTSAGGWWRAPAVRALHTGDGAGEAGDGPEGATSPDDGERQWWRVEAGAGRTTATGVFDLCFQPARGSWSLARVLD